MHWSSSPSLRTGFTTEERDRRWKRVRDSMARAHVDLLVVLSQWMAEDALYLANQNGAVVFPLEGEPALIVGGEGSNRALTGEGWIADRSSATPRGSTRVAYGEAVARKLGERGIKAKRVAIAGLEGHHLVLVRQPEGTVSYTAVKNVMAALPEAELVDGSPIVAEARHQKSEAELDVIREAVHIAEAGGAALARETRAGRAQADVFAAIWTDMLKAGAGDGTMLSWCGGPWGQPKWRFTTPPPGPVGDSWYIDTEIGPTFRGYNCQTEDPIVVGPVNDEARAIWDLGKEAFFRLCEAMKPGATWGEATREVKKLETKALGVEFLIHGRGLGNEGPMLIPVDTHKPFQDMPIVENSVFILKPYAYPNRPEYPHVTRSHSVTWGDTVVVRPRGAERLGTRPLELMQVS
jgi:Xaa-Pro aminopeptidase